MKKIKKHYKGSQKSLTSEMENMYSFYFAHSFYETIVFPSNQFHDPKFKNMIKSILNISRMDSINDQFSNEKDLLSYHTYIYQRYLCINKPNCWVYPSEKADDSQYPAQLRLSILSKKKKKKNAD